MSLLKREGRFYAVTMGAELRKAKTGIPTIEILHKITGEFDTDGSLQPVDDDLEITSYSYPFKKDRTRNERAIDNLKDVFGWDGTDFAFWSEAELPDCQITVSEDEYNGRISYKVKWINPADDDGRGKQKSDPKLIKELNAEFGPLLRAYSPPTKPAAKPKPKSPPKPTGAPSLTPQQAQDKAWDDFNAMLTGQETEVIEKSWFGALESFGQDPDAMTVKQWEDFIQHANQYIKDSLPF